MTTKLTFILPDGRKGFVEIIGNRSDYSTKELIDWIKWGFASAPGPHHPEMRVGNFSTQVYYGMLIGQKQEDPLTVKILFDRYAGKRKENVFYQNLAGWSGSAYRIKLKRPELAVGTLDFMAATGAVSADSKFKARMSRSFSQETAFDIVGYMILSHFQGKKSFHNLFSKNIPTPSEGLHVLAKRSAMQADESHHLARVQLNAKLKLDFGDYGEEIASFVSSRKRVLSYMKNRASELGDKELVRHLTTLESQVNALLTVEGPLTSLTHRVRQHIETRYPERSEDVDNS